MLESSIRQTSEQILLDQFSHTKGRWSIEQQLKFNEGLELYGKNWKKIQAYVKSRSLLQIRSHAQKYFMMKKKIQKRNKKMQKRIEKLKGISRNIQNNSLKIENYLSTNESINSVKFQFRPDEFSHQLTSPVIQYICPQTISPTMTFSNQNFYPNFNYNINISNPIYPNPSFVYQNILSSNLQNSLINPIQTSRFFVVNN